MSKKKRVVIPKETIDKIVSLHNEIMGQSKKTVRMIIEEGCYLACVKDQLPHGKFEKWVEKHTPIKPRHALNYRNIYEWRIAVLGAFIVESATVADLEFSWRWADKIIEEAKAYSSQRRFLAIFKWKKTRPEKVHTLMQSRFEEELNGRWPVLYMEDGVIKVKHRKEKNKWKQHKLWSAFDNRVWFKYALPRVRKYYFNEFPLEFTKNRYAYEQLFRDQDVDSKFFEGEEIKQYILENHQDTHQDSNGAEGTDTDTEETSAGERFSEIRNDLTNSFLQRTGEGLLNFAIYAGTKYKDFPYTINQPLYAGLDDDLIVSCFQIGIYGMLWNDVLHKGKGSFKAKWKNLLTDKFNKNDLLWLRSALDQLYQEECSEDDKEEENNICEQTA
ncbi:hypothetical protein GF340_03900 [Candidatus Peregrinibacteria bacterium]|nr:hypothetical protein [Candidatus Peregrinibacteria bacterium]